MFKEYPNNPMYLISESGEVFSLYSNKRLKPHLNQQRGYYAFIMVDPVTRAHITKTVHRCVAETFLPVVDGLTWVNHLDGNKENNHVSNLEWTNDTLNKAHAAELGLMIRGSSHHNSKLTEQDVHEICEMFSSGLSTGVALELFPHVSRGTMLNIRARRTWRHISKDYQWIRVDNKRNKVTCRDYRKHN